MLYGYKMDASVAGCPPSRTILATVHQTYTQRDMGNEDWHALVDGSNGAETVEWCLRSSAPVELHQQNGQMALRTPSQTMRSTLRLIMHAN